MSKVTQIRQHFAASTMIRGPFVMAADQVEDFAALADLGINLSPRDVADMARAVGMAMDANVLQPTIQAGTISTPAQFLQNWLPGLVRTITQARRIDELVGMTVGGSWEDEEVVQQVLEPTGFPQPYGDANNIPLASWNNSFERRTVVRFELGLNVGRLEEARTSRIPNINSPAEKRASVAVALEILRNRVGFYGYISGAGRTFGFLNDPNLPAYNTVAATGTGSSTLWSTKTFLQITADIRTEMAGLQTQSGDNIDPERTPITMGLATNRAQYLTVTSDFGISVRDWMRQTYPNLRVVTAPELNAANGGAAVFYLYADRADDGSSDGGRTFDQIVPAKMQSLGVEQRAKSYVEDYTNALAGIMLKRPWAIRRATGI